MVDENQKFENIVKRGLEEYFKRNPRVAVNLGKEEYQNEVKSGTKEYLEENLKWFGQWVDELKQLEGEKLNFENRISIKALDYCYTLNLFMYEDFSLWKRKPNGLEQFQQTIFLLFQRKGPTTDVAEAIISHLTKLPKYLGEYQSRFDDTPIPVVWRDLALEQVQATPKLLQTLTEAYSKTTMVPEPLKNKLLKIINESEKVFQNHVDWIENLPVDTDEYAWALGPEKFDKLLSLRKLPWDRKTLLKKGTKIFSTSLKKIQKIAKEIYPSKTFSEAIEAFFNEDLIPTFEETLEYARSEVGRAKEFIISNDLATIPQETLIVIETPPHLLPIIAAAAYCEPPYFDRQQPGIFMISPIQKERHSYTAISNMMIHEAYPGHHLDLACNNIFAPIIRLLGLSSFIAPAYETIEGWAIYCEELMVKQGFSKDPIKSQQLVSGIQLQESMKIMLDIQMQCKQRTIADAIKMWMNIIQLNMKAAKTVAIDSTTCPGYPLSYLIGKLLIEELLQNVKEKMGNQFSLKFFHDTILQCGDLPYFLLKEYFDEKIKNFSLITV
jgi:uncharacterized protein (DUF885 family)